MKEEKKPVGETFKVARESKNKIVSISLDSEMHDSIKKVATRLGHNNSSQVVRELISKYLWLISNDSDYVPVIIKIPSELLGKEDDLRDWLGLKAEAIADALS